MWVGSESATMMSKISVLSQLLCGLCFLPCIGSSAGAGSEVFHVYRHLRRRENIRQQFIQENAVKDDLEQEFQERLAKNHIEAEVRTAKKRAKR